MLQPWGSRGLVEVDGVIEGIQEICQKDVAGFAEKAKGALGDVRTLGDHRDGQKRRFLALSDALPFMRQTALEDWSFSGPRATMEFLTSVRESTNELSGYHLPIAQ